MRNLSIMGPLKNAKVLLDVKSSDKKQIIKKLINSFDLNEEQRKLLYNSVLQREKMGSTGIGNGIAIPHTRSMVVTDLMIAIGRPSTPLDFDAIDGKPVRLIFLIVAPPYASKREYLILLGKIAETFIEISSDEKLFRIKDKEDFKVELCNFFGG